MKRTTFFAYVMVTVAAMLISKGSATSRPKPELDFESLRAMSHDQLMSTIMEMGNQRREMEAEVARELQFPRSKQATLAAIFIAGMYRFEGAAEPLAKVISFHDDFYKSIIMEHSVDEYPAQGARYTIGTPAVGPLLNNLATSDDNNVRLMSANVLGLILHNGSAKARLQAEIQRKTDAKDKDAVAHLKAALPLLDPQ